MIITEQYSKQNTHKTETKDWLPVRISLNDLFTSLYADYKRNNGLLHLHEVWKYAWFPFARNSQNWKRCKNKERKRLFLKPASYSSWSWMLVEARSLQITACFQRAIIANYKNISFNSASLRNFFLCYSTAVLSSCKSRHASRFGHPVSSLICAVCYDSSIDCSFILDCYMS